MAARTIVRCGLCPTVITTTPERSWWDAMDHALDRHRRLLIECPQRVFFRSPAWPQPCRSARHRLAA